MHPFISIFNLTIPTYGIMIASGIVLANIIAFFFTNKFNDDFMDLLVIEGYVFLGAFFGSKFLYLIISYNKINWQKIFNAEYFNLLMKGGFVFYGGLIGGIISALLCGLIHKINTKHFLNAYCCLIPFIHSFGRIGCFLAGCCYGKPYNGFFSVVFPENSFALHGISLFPIQLIEAIFLFIIFIFLFVLTLKSNKTDKNILSIYLVLYGITRFFLEFFRYDSERGFFLFFSVSQWISILLLIIGFISFFRSAQA